MIMEEKIDITVDNKLTNEKNSLKKQYITMMLQSYLKEISIEDIICNDLTDINSTDNNHSNYGKLALLSESEPEQVFSFLINNNSFQYILNKHVDITALIYLMEIFSKIKLLKLSQTKTILSILDIIYNSKYLEHLNESLVDFTRLKHLISGNKLQEFITNCKTVLELMANPKPKAFLYDIIQSIELKCIESSSIDVKQLQLNNDNSETEEMMQMLKNLKITKHVQYDVKRWPQCYKNLSIYPVMKDITREKVILSPNIIIGSYDNVEHYLDVQFRLLHEDIIAPMREGIQYYKSVKEFGHNIKKMPNMHIFFNVRVKKNVTNNKISYIVKFYTIKDCSSDSKRFMSKSLLVFTNDNFNSMFFAIVIRMKNQNSLSPIKTLIIKPLGERVTIKFNSNYTMVESDAYFLPYFYTMDVLKTFCHYNFPMKSYIVYGNNKPKIPKYLIYNSENYNINGLQFNILNNNLWPDNQFLRLDSAQSIALKEALTKEFTVIQGPPGTGKTYIGLKIAKSIIDNMYKKNILKNPIVVVCYTNHALDQFLEGLIKITKKLVRIGYGCKSDILKPYILKNIQTPRTQQHLLNSYVVGLTTTGASIRHSLLLKLRPCIVIVEEAAEVLESHIVASLTEFCQQLILIGDHKQLRPKTVSHTLSKMFNFDISLFERMVKNGFPCYTLATQHRMQPEISALMKPIYPFLINHESVNDRSNIHGVTKNVYFIHHEMREEKVCKSYKNIHEVNFFMQFARYLFNQGYKQNQITILVTYREQLLELQKIRNTSLCLEYFRIECVDGYQGEENDIILLSLVRNNLYNKIGFLNIHNRVSVALSRARNGLYIMGNMNNLKSSSMWNEISEILVHQQSLGNNLTLCCEIHKNWNGVVCDSSDFANAKCSEICNVQMDCGHLCSHFCHYNDKSHETLYRCQQHCSKTLPCGFKIEIECWMRFMVFECPK